MTEDHEQLRERIADAIAKEVVVSGQTVTDLSGYLPLADAVLDAIAPLVDENTALRGERDELVAIFRSVSAALSHGEQHWWLVLGECQPLTDEQAATFDRLVEKAADDG